MPHNGYSHNLRGSPAGLRQEDQESRPDEVSRAFRANSQRNLRGGGRSQLDKRPVWFRGLLYGAPAQPTSAKDGLPVVAIRSATTEPKRSGPTSIALPDRDGHRVRSAPRTGRRRSFAAPEAQPIGPQPTSRSDGPSGLQATEQSSNAEAPSTNPLQDQHPRLLERSWGVPHVSG